ncbi:MAG: ABC transporter substrate-binding protein [Elusimicrobia bacterium]|nr:ABC transporter substrate-binding protein [Elusimicrobiota bacterium]
MPFWLRFFLLLLWTAPLHGFSQTLVVCDDTTDPVTLDPHRQFSQKTYTLLQQVFEGLVRFDAEGKIVPSLAVSWKRLDPLTVRFHLRRGVVFHNGEPFGAEAVRKTLLRYLDPKINFPGLAYIDSMERIEVVDPWTVDIKTRFPDGLLLHRLAWIFLIVPPGYLEKEGAGILAERPVGTGPFRFVRWIRGREVVLEANDRYWRAGVPSIRELRFRFLPAQAQVQALLDGELHIVTELPGTFTRTVFEHHGTEVLKKETFYTFGATFNVSQKPLSDPRVRQAINHAIHREDLIRYDLFGNGRSLAALSMPGEEGHHAGLRPYPYDPEKARRLLWEAGVSMPVKLKALVYVQGKRTAQILSKQLSQVGVLLEMDWIETGEELIAALRKGNYDLAMGGMPDPMAHSFFIQSILLYSKSPYSLHKDTEYDRVLEAMVAELNPDARQKKGEDLDRLIWEQALSIFTYQRLRTYGVRRGVRFVPSITGMPYFDRVELESSEAARKP